MEDWQQLEDFLQSTLPPVNYGQITMLGETASGQSTKFLTECCFLGEKEAAGYF